MGSYLTSVFKHVASEQLSCNLAMLLLKTDKWFAAEPTITGGRVIVVEASEQAWLLDEIAKMMVDPSTLPPDPAELPEIPVSPRTSRDELLAAQSNSIKTMAKTIDAERLRAASAETAVRVLTAELEQTKQDLAAAKAASDGQVGQLKGHPWLRQSESGPHWYVQACNLERGIMYLHADGQWLASNAGDSWKYDSPVHAEALLRAVGPPKDVDIYSRDELVQELRRQVTTELVKHNGEINSRIAIHRHQLQLLSDAMGEYRGDEENLADAIKRLASNYGDVTTKAAESPADGRQDPNLVSDGEGGDEEDSSAMLKLAFSKMPSDGNLKYLIKRIHRRLAINSGDQSALVLLAEAMMHLVDRLPKQTAVELEFLTPDDEWETSDKMVYLTAAPGSERQAFRCECRCNVFRRHFRNNLRYKCNGCGATYTGEP